MSIREENSTIRMGLAKARKIVFARLEDNEFMVLLTDKDDNPVATFEPREVFEGETYILDFGHDLVVGVPKLNEEINTI